MNTQPVTGRLLHMKGIGHRIVNGEAVFYVNGSEVSRRRVPGSVSAWQPHMHLALANEVNETRPWLGSYHGLAIYNRPLTEAEWRLVTSRKRFS